MILEEWCDEPPTLNIKPETQPYMCINVYTYLFNDLFIYLSI